MSAVKEKDPVKAVLAWSKVRTEVPRFVSPEGAELTSSARAILLSPVLNFSVVSDNPLRQVVRSGSVSSSVVSIVKVIVAAPVEASIPIIAARQADKVKLVFFVNIFDEHGQALFKRLPSPFAKLRGVEAWFERLKICTYLMAKQRKLGDGYAQQLVRDFLIEQVICGTELHEMPQNVDYRIAKILGHIRSHLSADLRIEELAGKAGVGARRFRQLFHEATGMSPKQYLRRERLSYARSLIIKNPSLTVQQVATRSGFNDSHNFHVIYRKVFGETPGMSRRLFQRKFEE